MNPPRSVLVIRSSAIGDVVMASGLIPAMREAWPRAHIAWLAEPGVVELLRHNPRLDDVLVWRKSEWIEHWRRRAYAALWRDIRNLRAELRAPEFDLVLDLQGLLKSAFLGRLSGASERIGLASRECSGWLMTRVIVPPGGDRRMSSEYRFLTGALHLNCDAFRLDLVPGEVAEQRADAVVSEYAPKQGFVVLAPFTTRPQKHWFEDRWIDLAAGFKQSGLSVIVLGGPVDLQSAERIAAAAGVHSVAGRVSLGESAALIARAALLVGVDTGLTHMGIAQETPTLALFGSTRPYLDPMFGLARILYEPLPCSPCRRHPTCGGRYDCMRAHSVDRVFRTAMDLLDG